MACLKPHIANEIKAVLDHGPIVQGRERFLDLLLKENVAYRQRIRPHLLGVHPGNRHSVGLHVNEVHSLLSEICDVGFAEAEVRAICVEVSSSDTAIGSCNINRRANSTCHQMRCDMLPLLQVTSMHPRLCIPQ